MPSGYPDWSSPIRQDIQQLHVDITQLLTVAYKVAPGGLNLVKYYPGPFGLTTEFSDVGVLLHQPDKGSVTGTYDSNEFMKHEAIDGKMYVQFTLRAYNGEQSTADLQFNVTFALVDYDPDTQSETTIVSETFNVTVQDVPGAGSKDETFRYVVGVSRYMLPEHHLLRLKITLEVPYYAEGADLLQTTGAELFVAVPYDFTVY